MEISAFYGGRHPSELPFYSQWEVAYAIGVPASTLRGWMAPVPAARGLDVDSARPLIVGPEGPHGRLSFTNLTEAYVIAELRRKAGVRILSLRRAVWMLRKEGVHRPLLNADHLLARGSVYIDKPEGLVDYSAFGQYVLREVVRGYLTRVQIEAGLPVQLYPWVMNTEKRSVLIDPTVRFGQPVLNGTGIKTSTVRERVAAGETPEHIASSYGVELSLVSDALRFEAQRARPAAA